MLLDVIKSVPWCSTVEAIHNLARMTRRSTPALDGSGKFEFFRLICSAFENGLIYGLAVESLENAGEIAGNDKAAEMLGSWI